MGAPDTQKIDAEKQRVHELVEAEQGDQHEKLTNVFVDRVESFVDRLMSSNLKDPQKEKILNELTGYLRLVDSKNIKNIQGQFGPVLNDLERNLPQEMREHALKDADAKLGEIINPDIRKELLDQWHKVSELRSRYTSKKDRLDAMMKANHLEVEGTELEYYFTSIDFHTDFLDTQWHDYNDIKPNDDDAVGKRRTILKTYLEQAPLFVQVLDEVQQRISPERLKKEPIRTISLEDSQTLGEQKMLIRKKRYDQAVKDFWKRIDDLKISHEHPFCQQMETNFSAVDMQFKELEQQVFSAQDEPARIAAAQLANKFLMENSQGLESSVETIDGIMLGQKAKTGLEAMKIIGSEKFASKILGFGSALLIPQIGIVHGYAAAADAPMTTEKKVLEGMDFGISLVPFAGGVFDVVQSFRGETLSGRKMGSTECWVRGGIGVVSVVVDVFSFGLGGSLVKAGGKAALKATAEVTAKTVAKTALEATTKVALESAAKDVVGAAAKGGVETLAKAGTEVVVEGAVKEGVQVLGREVPKEVLKGFGKGSTMAQRKAAREFTEQAVRLQLEPIRRKIEQEMLAKVASGDVAKGMLMRQAENASTKYVTGLAEKGAALAVPSLTRRAFSKLTLGAVEAGGKASLEKGVIASATKEVAIKEALAGGKRVAGDYYAAAQFVKQGEVMWGKMAGHTALHIGKSMAKGWWHLHNPLEVIRTIRSFRSVRVLAQSLRRVPRGSLLHDKAALADVERELKADLLADAHNPKEIDALLADARKMTFDKFMAEHGKKDILADADVQDWFRAYSEQFGKSFGQKLESSRGLYNALRDVAPESRIASFKMLRDARKMSIEELKTHKDYARFFASAEKGVVENLEAQLKNYQALRPVLPVNVKRLEDALKRKVATAQDLLQAEKELKSLKEKEDFITTFPDIFNDKKAVFDSKGRYRFQNAQEKELEICFDIFKELPSGPLKQEILAERKILADAKKVDLKEGSKETLELTFEAMQKIIFSSNTQADIVAAEKVLAEAREQFSQGLKNVPFQRPPKVGPKKSVHELTQKRLDDIEGFKKAA